ncbi:MAG TPA: hypothetical protein VHS06_05120 [Chloroflexota bacterium]|nr:hypothetical protein [Chloroflexota bacterium]
MNPNETVWTGNEASAKVASHTPGRLRVRLDRNRRSRESLHEARRSLELREGIRQVEGNSTTGSLLLHYDPEQLNHDQLLSILKDAGVIVRDILEAGGTELPAVGKSTTATSITDSLNDLDRRLSSITGRRLDLKLLFPATLGALGLRQVLTQGLGLNQVPAYVLLWYAFDSFWKFHAGRSPEPVEAGAQQ